jgi:uncharacterized iron-regulated protein
MTKLNHLTGILSLSFLLGACAHAQIWEKGLRKVEKAEMFQSLASYQVILLGENHGFQTHKDQHMEILNDLKNRGFQIHVGLEFFYYPDQALVDQYRDQTLSESDFLSRINWGSPSFDYYRDQAVFGDKTWALNAPRWLTSHVAKFGLGSLGEELSRLMPPNFAMGRESYKQRFEKAIGGGGHFSDPEILNRYFAAQSIWDDTMAWNIQKIISENPDIKLVVIVGEFHTQYGGGLGDRLKARGVQQVTTVSQVRTEGLSEDQIQESIMPHPDYGPRADWIWAKPAVK